MINQNTQNAEQRCKGSTKGMDLLSYHVVGYALIVDFSIKTIRQ
jgi:hypothetical protein